MENIFVFINFKGLEVFTLATAHSFCILNYFLYLFCYSLRENVNNMKQRYMRDSSPNLDGCNNTTVEFFPVEWRSALTLDNGLIDCITPHKILNIRQMLNASFMDIMYYNSPQYREEVSHSCLFMLEGNGSCLKTGQHSISVIIKIIICIFVFGAVSQILFKMVIYLSWTINNLFF